MVGLKEELFPSILRMAGLQNCSNATMLLTGFPGRPIKGVTLGVFGSLITQNASGFEGVMLIYQKLRIPRDDKA